MQSLEKHVNFENENSRKAYYREFKKVRSHLRHFKACCSFKDGLTSSLWIHSNTQEVCFQNIFFFVGNRGIRCDFGSFGCT